jgi:hypothetical protein
MPQFDKITFFSQIFWLMLIFFGFYVLMVHIFIPKLATVLKTRKKKLGGGASGVFALNTEQLSIIATKNLLVQNSVGNAKNNINNMLSKSINWLMLTLLDTNSSKLITAHSVYLKNSASTIAKQHSSVKKS